MLVPSIFEDNLFDEMLRMPWHEDEPERRVSNSEFLMQTDIKETETGYQLDVDLPGFKKDEIGAKLEDGYLTISATRNVKNDDEDKDKKYIRRERFTGTCSRTFYVGKGLKPENIQANFEDGVLKLDIPRMEQVKNEDNHHITINGV